MGPLCGPGGTAFCVLDAALPAVLLVLLAAAGVMARATRDGADKADRGGPARAATAVVYAACGVLGAGHLAWAVYQELQQWPIANVVYDAAFFLLWTAVAVGYAWAARARVEVKLWAVAWPAVALYAYSTIAAALHWHPQHAEPGGSGRSRELLLGLRGTSLGLATITAVLLSVRQRGKRQGLHEGLLDKTREDVEAGRKAEEGVALRTHTTMQLLRTALKYAWPTTRGLQLRVAGTILMICIGRVLNLAVPILYGRMIDRLSDASAATHGPHAVGVPVREILFPSVAVYLLVNAVPSLGLMSKTRVFVWFPVMQAASRRVKVELLEHMLQMDLTFHLMRKTGEVTRKMDRGANAMTSIMRTFFLSLTPQLIDIFGAVGYLATRMHAWVAVILVFTFVTYIPLSVYATRRRNALQRSMNKRDNVMYARSTDALVNYETVKYFNNESLESRKYGEVVDLFQSWRYLMNTSLVWVDILQSAIVYSGTIIGLIVCTNEVANGTLTVGGVGVFLSLVSTLMRPLYSFEDLYESLTQDIVDMEAMFDLLEQAPAVQDREGARDLVVSEGAVACEGVAFGYTPGTLILKNVSFSCPGGKTLALTGHTGSGKSTALRLLFRFYDPAEGRITVDGVDIASCTQRSLRAAMAVVPQDTVLFNDSIRENIRYGRPSASDEEVEEAATAAAIHDHICGGRFPDGYATVVGERGLRLSGGEKQRVAVARAILKDPRILLLDEATSALDSLTEERIKQAVNALRRTRTTIIVAHRLSTVMDADIIVVMQEGRVVEVGSHAELIAQRGHFAAMWGRQVEAGAAPRIPLPAIAAAAEPPEQ